MLPKRSRKNKVVLVGGLLSEDISIESLAEQYKIHANSIYK
jgi:hypothetical protein